MHLTHHKEQRWVYVNTGINFLVPYNAQNFVTIWRSTDNPCKCSSKQHFTFVFTNQTVQTLDECCPHLNTRTNVSNGSWWDIQQIDSQLFNPLSANVENRVSS
jgi:hypothetical protein